MSLVKMSALLDKIEDNSYAVGSFNVSNMEMVMGAIKAAEDLHSPIILQISEGRLPYSPLALLGPIMVAGAKNAAVPVAVHLDHGVTMETIQLALDLGFTSVMFDGSKRTVEENIAMTKVVKKMAAVYDADIEAEIGRIGGSKGTYSADELITTVEEAKYFADATGTDALAVAIGTVHGHYREKPDLHIERLREIASVVSCPLVLHGGSGISDADFRRCIRGGIRKINIATSSYDAVARHIYDRAQEDRHASYFDFSAAAAKGTYENVKRHMLVFGTENKVK